MKIGFFDSGLGGLTIMKTVAKELPLYDYVFYGDTANLPYGDKTEEQVYELTVAGIEYLFEAGCLLVIVACNTASAETVSKIQSHFLPNKYPNKKVLGVIIPTVEKVVEMGFKNAVLIGTARTVNSGKYEIEFRKLAESDFELKELSTPDLVPLIEIGDVDLASEIAVKKIDTDGGEGEVVVLGCTHYSEIKNQLRDHYGADKKVISQDEIIPEKLRAYLASHPEIESQLSRGGERVVHLTEHKPYFDKIMQQLLGGVMVEEE
jgi:glutamate racemase